MRKKARIAAYVAAAAFVVAGIRTVVSFAAFSRAERQFGSIQKGESRTSVISKLGKPNYYSGKCGVSILQKRTAQLSTSILIRSRQLFLITTSFRFLKTNG
jgi:hypothetical protein